MAGLTSSTIGRKYAMALSAMFLLLFLIMHLSVNLISVFSPSAFNSASEFMGYNPLIQFLMQPILGFAVIFHFVMGFVLELKNRSARPVKYAMNNGSANSTWMSRNMIISGLVVLAFLGLHMYDFWWHEINFKYVEANTPDNERFWHELHAKFADAGCNP
jgi:succinate dehydrogenase / fumarate reductase, cytochrome b subunit